MAAGSSPSTIRDRLGLTVHTWRDDQRRIYESTELHSNAEFFAMFG